MNDAFQIEEDAASQTATLRFIRPDDGNRLSLRDISVLAQLIRELGRRRETKLLMIRADGPDFCLGRASAPSGSLAKSALEVRNDVTQPILDVYAEIRTAQAPVLAVVQGRANGFGCALVAQCDLAIAADDASFSLPEMDHDLPPTLAMSVLLHKIPPKRMLHMVYTRESIIAAEALKLGIVGRAVPRKELEAAVLEFIANFADRKRDAICAIKEYAQSALYADPGGAARLAANLLATVLSSPTGN